MLIREAKESDAAEIAKVQVDTWQQTYRGIVPDNYLNSLTCENKEQYWREFLVSDETHLVFVAETEEKQIVGFAAVGQNQDAEKDFTGELYTLYLLADWQRRGIGRLLVQTAAQSLLKQQLTSMIVWVLGDNPFRAFYESLGGEYISERYIDIGGASLLDIAYGWRDLQLLLESQRWNK